MRQRKYILCYDISSKKRVAKVARLVEAQSIRIQRSVYFFDKISKRDMDFFVSSIVKYLEINKDDLRVYEIGEDSISLQRGVDLNNAYVII